jgi:acyl carrier protein
MKPVAELIATQLRISVDRVRDDLGYGAIAEWDSLAHVDLMTALEAAYGVSIDEDRMIELTTVGAIRAFVEGTPG